MLWLWVGRARGALSESLAIVSGKGFAGQVGGSASRMDVAGQHGIRHRRPGSARFGESFPAGHAGNHCG